MFCFAMKTKITTSENVQYEFAKEPQTFKNQIEPNTCMRRDLQIRLQC